MPNMTAKTRGNKFRKVFKDALRRNNKSTYWLATNVANQSRNKISVATVYKYMSGEIDTSGRVIEKCMEVLDMDMPEVKQVN